VGREEIKGAEIRRWGQGARVDEDLQIFQGRSVRENILGEIGEPVLAKLPAEYSICSAAGNSPTQPAVMVAMTLTRAGG
jgi:hypothetical protein